MKSILKFYQHLSFKRVIIILVVSLVFLSMAVFGISRYSSGVNDSTIIKVGNLRVASSLFLAEYNLIAQQNSAKIAENPYIMQNILKQMISKYVSGLMFVNEANSLHIGAGDDLVYKIIANTPYFKGEDGKFSKQLYQQIVNKIYGRENIYIENLKNDLKQTQLTGSLLNSLYQSNKISKYLIESLSQSRTIDYITFNRSAVKNIPLPTKNDLLNILNNNKDVFTLPEYRSFQIVSINLSDLLKQVTVTDKEINDYYNANKNSYLTEETRNFEQVLFNTEKDANKFYDQYKNKGNLKNPTTSVTELTKVNKASLPSELAAKVFSAPLNTVLAPVKSDLGYHVIMVTKVNAPKPQPLASVSKSIKAEITGNKMSALYESLKNNLSTAVNNNKSLSDIAKEFKGKLITVSTVNQYGFDNKNNALTGLATNKDILNAAFSLPLNKISEPITTPTAFYVIAVNKIIPEHLQSLEEAKDQLISQWNYTHATNVIMQKAERVATTLSENKNIKTLGNQVKTITISRDTPIKNNPFTAVNIDQLFSSKKNVPIQGTMENGNIFIAVVNNIVNKNSSNMKEKNKDQLNQYLSNMYNQDILTEIFNKLNSKYKVIVNDKFLKNNLENSK